jgi:hypothetical protein
MTLHIGRSFNLPLDLITQTVAILAKRRAGKSYAMRRIVEQLFRAGQQVVLVDPKGDQWGIRSAADGRGPGLPIVILGGERGDIPLEPSGGEIVAKLVVEERTSVLLDLSPFRKSEVATFMTGFMEALYRLKAREVYRTPMMLVIDEADAIAPQKPQKGEERMLGAAEDIVRRGGQRGIGCILVSQRSAVLNKNVLTQAQMLVALRTIAPQDLAALNAWIDVHGTPDERKVLMESLPALPVGDAWFWSPGWPTVDGIFERVHVLPIETFDSGATPKPGEKHVEPKHAADVDLEALRRQMAATVERAKAEDPKELRRRIADLERQLAAKGKAAAAAKTNPAAGQAQIERAVAKALQHRQQDDGLFFSLVKRSVPAIIEALKAQEGRLENLLHSATERTKGVRVFPDRPRPVAPAAPPEPARPASQNRVEPPEPWPEPTGGVKPLGRKGKYRMLVALAQQPQGLSAGSLGIRAGLSPNSGTFSNYLSELKSPGWVEGERTHFQITEAGFAALGDYEPLPTGRALLEYWLHKMGDSGKARMLQALAEVYPNALTAEELGAAANISPNSGTFSNYLSELKTLELVQGDRGELRLAEELA